MVNTTKVLTVSYGAFSCTLEGFDDSFEAMKTIAEYFRTLAAEDPYFGAEPPRPDADHMARITSSPASPRVEAHRNASGIVLRAGGTSADADNIADQVELALDTGYQPMAGEGTLSEPVETRDFAAADPAPREDSIAVKLQRIRAVVAASPAAQVSEFSEAEHAETIEGQSQSADPANHTFREEDDALMGPSAEHVQTHDDPAEECAPAFADHAPATGQSISEITPDVAVSTPALEQRVAKDEASPDSNAAPHSPEPTVDETVDEDDVAPPPPPRPGRLVKVVRADFEAAIASGLLEEVDEGVQVNTVSSDPMGTASASPEPETALSPEDEDDLKRELEAVEAELNGTAKPAPAATPFVLAQPSQPPQQREADVSRLMATATQKLDEADAQSNHDTYLHLRAAAAADLSSGPRDVSTQDVDYRSDLADAMRPDGPATRTERPAPLKLVAAQRIDEGPETPAQPRPVLAEAPALQEDPAEVDFPTFAERHHAGDTEDLVGLAAIHLSQSDGTDGFTRRQLFRHMREVQGKSFIRDNAIASLVRLIDDGKIAKLDDGRFTATDRLTGGNEARAVS